ncbi:MAG TPA: PH domain-containing protein, partial [Thermomicrobiales bacterium]|nr:PH domain-containing protein [Thermomicrobiales bacterium]
MTDPATDPSVAARDEHASETPVTASEDITWHRMSSRFIVVGTLRQLRGLVVPAALILLTRNMGEGRSNLIYIGIALIVTVFAALLSLVDWWNFRYALADHELLVRSGVVQKQERVVPYGRIQAINLDEAPLERLVGIVRVKVETAAGGTADIEIKGIDRSAAPRLREALATARVQARQQGDAEVPPIAPAEETRNVPKAVDVGAGGELLRRLSTPELFALGATSGRIGPMAAVIGAILQFGTDIMPQTWWNRIPWQEAEALRSVSVATALLVVIAVVAWVMAIASTALTFGGFELHRNGDQLIVQHGLLDRRRRTIPIQRIQAVIVGEQLLRQPFHHADLRFESAGGEVEGASGDSGVLFPYLPLHEVEPLLRRAAPEFATDPTVPMAARLPIRSLRRYIFSATVGWVVFVGAAAAALGFWLDTWIDVVAWRQVLLLLVVAPVFAGLGWARWRDGGWEVDGSNLLLRWRTVSRQTFITNTSRIQRRRITTDP